MIEAKRGANYMTKKDYVLIAEVIRIARHNWSFEEDQLKRCAGEIAIADVTRTFVQEATKLDRKFKQDKFWGLCNPQDGSII